MTTQGVKSTSAGLFFSVNSAIINVCEQFICAEQRPVLLSVDQLGGSGCELTWQEINWAAGMESLC